MWSRRSAGSPRPSPVVGSSSTIRSLSPRWRSRTATRWVWPPESLSTGVRPGRRCRSRASPSSTGSGRGCSPVISVSRCRTVTWAQAAGLQHGADPARRRVAAAEPNTWTVPLLGCRSPSSISIDVDLPAPFGPEEGHRLPAPQFQGQPVNRPDPAVHLADVLERDRMGATSAVVSPGLIGPSVLWSPRPPGQRGQVAGSRAGAGYARKI